MFDVSFPRGLDRRAGLGGAALGKGGLRLFVRGFISASDREGLCPCLNGQGPGIVNLQPR